MQKYWYSLNCPLLTFFSSFETVFFKQHILLDIKTCPSLKCFDFSIRCFFTNFHLHRLKSLDGYQIIYQICLKSLDCDMFNLKLTCNKNKFQYFNLNLFYILFTRKLIVWKKVHGHLALLIYQTDFLKIIYLLKNWGVFFFKSCFIF